jgi:hypothetical protein
LIWCGNDQIHGIGLGPWIQKQPKEFCSCAIKILLDLNIPM